MSGNYDDAVNDLVAEMPAAWTTDYKRKVAQSIVAGNAMHEVDRGVRQFAGDASADPETGNYLQGGYGDMTNRTYRRASNGYDQNGEEDYIDDPDMQDDPNTMPPRGRTTPAATWAYACGGDANSELSPDNLAAFVDAAVRGFDPDERSQFFAQLSETLGNYDDMIGPTNGNGDNVGTPQQQAERMRNGNGNDTAARRMMMAGDRRRPAMDSGSGFLRRFPEAAHITTNVFGRR